MSAPSAPPPEKEPGSGPGRHSTTTIKTLSVALVVLFAGLIYGAFFQPLYGDPYGLKGPRTFWDNFLYPQGHKALTAVPVVPLENGLLVPRAVAEVGLLPDNPESLNHIQFSKDLRQGWAVDDDGGLLVSEDGGRTWDWRPVMSEGRFPLKKKASLRRRANEPLLWLAGGLEPEQQKAPPPYKTAPRPRLVPLSGGFSAVHFVSPDIGWLVTDNGQIVRTRNGGESWTLSPTPEGTKPLAVYFTGLNVGVAVGERGLVLETQDGGLSWQQVDTDTNVTLHDVFLTDFIGRAVGENGVYVTFDGITSDWLGRDSGVSWTLRSVFVHRNGTYVWAAGLPSADSAPKMIQSLDGGETWETLGFRQTPAYWLVAWMLLFSVIAILAVVARGQRTGGGARLDQFVSLDGSKIESVQNNVIAISTLQVHGAGSSDKPLGVEGDDALGFAPLASGLSRFIRNNDTAPPITFAVTGKWGTGKSTLMKMVLDDLKSSGAHPVWFNAWHHQKEQRLLAALLENIRAQAIPPFWRPESLSFRWRLLWRRLHRDPRSALVPGLIGIVAIAIALEWSLRSLQWTQSVPVTELIHSTIEYLASLGLEEEASKGTPPTPVSSEGAGATGLGAFAAVFAGMVALLRAKLMVTSINPAKLMSDLSGKAKIRDLKDQLGYRHKFGNEFSDVCHVLRRRDNPGLILVIDDLDRCGADGVMEILEASNFLVSVADCFVLLGLDPEQVEKCVGSHFRSSVNAFLEKDEVDTGNNSRLREFAREYLEKLINIVIPVPGMTPETSMNLWAPQSASRHLTLLRDRKEVAFKRRRTEGIAFFVFSIGLLVALFLGLQALIGALNPVEDIHRLKSRAGKGASETELSGGNGFPGPDQAFYTAVKNFPDAPAPLLDQSEQPGPEGPARPDLTEEMLRGGFLLTELFSNYVLNWPGLLGATLLGYFLTTVAVRTRYGQDDVRDGKDFKKALKICNPAVFALFPTPRGVKRFQNRMRYFAMRLSQDRELAEEADVEGAASVTGRGSVDEKKDASNDKMNITEPQLWALGLAAAYDSKLLNCNKSEMAEALNMLSMDQILGQDSGPEEDPDGQQYPTDLPPREKVEVFLEVFHQLEERFDDIWPAEKERQFFREMSQGIRD